MNRIPPLEPFHERYEAVAVRIGLAGNALFVLGSVLFLLGPNLAATLCWLLGSTGMLIRAVGRLYADKRQESALRPTHAMAGARRETDTAAG